ncbi:hypothetical protein ABZ456_29160 [Streptomyces sp. NPDC005776]
MALFGLLCALAAALSLLGICALLAHPVPRILGTLALLLTLAALAAAIPH